IYGSRPWKIYGEHPAAESVIKSNNFNEDKLKYGAQDIRFTAQGDVLYAFCLGAPTQDVRIASLGSKAGYNDKAVSAVTMLGSGEKIHWKQHGDALTIRKPVTLPGGQVRVTGFRFEFK
ncbi:MAG TPA: alpha-L-fucosidase C-terminal domain-containing protein, partial [Chitinophagaceae bacterium]